MGIAFPYFILWLTEAILGSIAFALTNNIKGIFLAISFRAYLSFWS